MNIKLKYSNSHWITVGTNDNGEEVKFLIDYPSMDQQENLKKLFLASSNMRNMEFDKDGKSINFEHITIDNYKDGRYKRKYLQCVIKDWSGFDVKCELENGMLKDELIAALTRDDNQTNELYNLIQRELEFNSSDKKK